MTHWTAKRRKVALWSMLWKSAKQVVPESDIKFLYAKPFEQTIKIYAIRSPLTNTWVGFEVSDRMLLEKCIPREAHELTEYYCGMRETLEDARDLQVFNHDIKALTQEESRIFGVCPYPSPAPNRMRRSFLEYRDDI